VAGAHRSAGAPAFPCSGPRRGTVGSKRSGWGYLSRVARVGGGARTAEHRQREAAAEQARRGGARGARVRRGERK
jgi:hypothetical protein